MIAIPAIDLIDNQIVRLFQGDYSRQTNYELNPLEYAKKISASGLEHLHLVDLSGAKEGKLIHQSLMLDMVTATNLKVDFGGGIKTKNDIEALLSFGANQVVIGSLCVKDPETVVAWIREFGIEKFVLALDTDGKHLKINGWQNGSGVTLEETMNYFSDFEGLSILTTDIRRDGTGTGPSVALYASLVKQFPKQKWIASGGVESISDLQELRKIGCYACVVGKALLDGKITLTELKAFNDGSL